MQVRFSSYKTCGNHSCMYQKYTPTRLLNFANISCCMLKTLQLHYIVALLPIPDQPRQFLYMYIYRYMHTLALLNCRGTNTTDVFGPQNPDHSWSKPPFFTASVLHVLWFGVHYTQLQSSVLRPTPPGDTTADKHHLLFASQKSKRTLCTTKNHFYNNNVEQSHGAKHMGLPEYKIIINRQRDMST